MRHGLLSSQIFLAFKLGCHSTPRLTLLVVRPAPTVRVIDLTTSTPRHRRPLPGVSEFSPASLDSRRVTQSGSRSSRPSWRFTSTPTSDRDRGGPSHFPASVGIPTTSPRKTLLPPASHPTTRTSDLQTLVQHHLLRSGAWATTEVNQPFFAYFFSRPPLHEHSVLRGCIVPRVKRVLLPYPCFEP